MSIASEITRLQSAKSNIRTEIINKGVTVPSTITLDQYPSYIASIPTGGTDYAPEILAKTITSYSNSTITLLGKYAFNDCKSLTQINCPNVATVSNYAFTGCNHLSTITLSSLYDKVEIGTFAECSLTSIPNESVITYVNGAAFFSCSRLSKINLSVCSSIGNSVLPNPTYNGNVGAFQSCVNLSSIDLPICTYIGSSAFFKTGITSLDMSTVMPSLTSMGWNVFANCSSLSSVNINCPLSIIPSYTFMSCSHLANVSFGSSVNTIGNNAFAYCSNLTTISLTNNISNISTYAFTRCSNLSTLYIPSDIDHVISLANTNAFSGTKLSGTGATGTIYVPSSWLASYKASYYWSSYSARMSGY